MFSILPAMVSLLFLTYGAYVLRSRGLSRISLSFFLICITTFCWQFTWAVLFQTQNARAAMMLVKFGYLPILFLPTTLYHFIAELTRRQGERRRVAMSYVISAALGVVMLGSDGLVAGLYPYFFGFYPKAGWLHPVHLLQTVLVVGRGLVLLYQRQQVAVSTERIRLRYCLASVLIYFFAAVDYLCNYGVEFYPPGVLFIAISLGLIAQAIVRHDLLADPLQIAATIAHEMRTPLATVHNQSRVLAKGLPELLEGYRLAVDNGLHMPSMRPEMLSYLGELPSHIDAEVIRSTFIVDMMLATARSGVLDRGHYATHSVKKCVDEALACYPFEPGMRNKVTVTRQDDFNFHGCEMLLVFVLYNLLKNALHAIQSAGYGEIEIAFYPIESKNVLTVSDTGPGIPEHVRPQVFDPFYTTRASRGGTGMGLAFCKRVLTSFSGTIRCASQPGSQTCFAIEFPGAESRLKGPPTSVPGQLTCRGT